MGLFRKPKVEEKRKLILTTNRQGLAEYRCPYCNYLLKDGHPRLIERPKESMCISCGKEFI